MAISCLIKSILFQTEQKKNNLLGPFECKHQNSFPNGSLNSFLRNNFIKKKRKKTSEKNHWLHKGMYVLHKNDLINVAAAKQTKFRELKIL